MNIKNLFGKAAPQSRFKAGQRWRYRTRAVEPGSTLVVCRVETVAEETVVHISLNDVRVRVSDAPDYFSPVIGHMPVAESALEASVVELVEENAPLPDFEAGYRQWKNARGGFWTMPVAQCVEAMEVGINS